ncbi:hypothetical protein SAY87_026799 [Trapa incisa]|uniref:RING-type E3 ubiquitin transferase n=1 Tax=Trapa incisa TaxID=236973 RepID=A0AAN7JM47_9MYRT|nr:hypothetical protein SAY87_026799 [Trapa incisa]
MEGETALIFSSLSVLSPQRLSLVVRSVFSASLHHNRRISALLSSPTLFLLTLRHLHSLSLPGKALLIARHLLSSLRLLTSHLDRPLATASLISPHLFVRYRDLDAALLLLLLCDLQRRDPQALASRCPSDWRMVLQNRCSVDALSISGIGVYNGSVLIPFVETVARCWKFVSSSSAAVDGSKSVREAPASVAVVVSLPSVEISTGGGGGECAICREGMRKGRDVCELPCRHRYHWLCVLPWLRKRNTCPCCRFELPTDDVITEIYRLWNLLTRAAPEPRGPTEAPSLPWCINGQV